MDLPHGPGRSEWAAALTASKRDVPHYYLTVDVSMDAALALRGRLNSRLEK